MSTHHSCFDSLTRAFSNRVDDFDKVGARLLRLEKSVDRNTAAVESLARRSDTLAREADGDKHLDRDADAETYETSVASNHFHHVDNNNGCIVSGLDGAELFHGSCSLLSLLIESDTIINNIIKPRLSLRNILSSLAPKPAGFHLPHATSWDEFLMFKSKVYRELSQSVVQHNRIDLSHDGQPLVLPSRELLERVIQGYFKHIHPVTPLVDQTRLQEAVGTYYTSRPSGTGEGVDLAWAVIFNYIVIRCLAGMYMPLESRVSNMDFASANALEQPFIVNIRRALAKLDYFIKPTLVNVQALLSLVSFTV